VTIGKYTSRTDQCNTYIEIGRLLWLSRITELDFPDHQTFNLMQFGTVNWDAGKVRDVRRLICGCVKDKLLSATKYPIDASVIRRSTLDDRDFA